MGSAVERQYSPASIPAGLRSYMTGCYRPRFWSPPCRETSAPAGVPIGKPSRGGRRHCDIPADGLSSRVRWIPDLRVLVHR